MGIFKRKKSTVDSVVDSASVLADSADKLGADKLGTDAEVVADMPSTSYKSVRSADAGENIGNLLDAGVLWLPLLEESELQFSTDVTQQNIMSVRYVKAGAASEMQLFAAPRNADIWEKMRFELRMEFANAGGRSTETVGEYGTELQVQLPAGAAFSKARFLAISGDRWLLRVNLYGDVPADYWGILDEVVVNRGQNPYPPQKVIPLRLPEMMTEDE